MRKKTVLAAMQETKVGCCFIFRCVIAFGDTVMSVFSLPLPGSNFLLHSRQLSAMIHYFTRTGKLRTLV